MYCVFKALYNIFDMGRRKTANYYKKKAQEAEARETYYRNRPARPRGGDAVIQKNLTSFIYRSMLLKWTNTAGDQTSNDHLPFRIDVSARVISKVTNAANLGLLGVDTNTVNTSIARPIRGSGIRPSQANWYNGTGTPVPVKTAWNSSWTRYYDSAQGNAQSHFSAPLSVAAGGFGPVDIEAKFKALFAGNNKTAYLGASNGRAELKLEYASGLNAINT